MEPADFIDEKSKHLGICLLFKGVHVKIRVSPHRDTELCLCFLGLLIVLGEKVTSFLKVIGQDGFSDATV